MIKSAPRAAARIHPLDCTCGPCNPTAPGRRLTPSDIIALHAIAGVPVGLALCKLIDLAIGGDGLLAAFGL